MMGSVAVKIFGEPEIRQSEILRYAGGGREDDATCELMHACLAEARPVLAYRTCFCEICKEEAAFLEVDSEDIRKYLSDCERVILLAATVGIGIDRLIAKYGRISPSRALMMQAIGAERVEALCDIFCRDLAIAKTQEGMSIKPRFSPGYGDLALYTQHQIFDMLDCVKHIGLTLNDSLLMSPTKSVTAIIGVI